MHSFAQIRDTIVLILCVASMFFIAELFYFQTPSSCYLPPDTQSVSQSEANGGALPPAGAEE